jgi:hypothetical protein
MQQLGLSVSANKQLVKWWNLNVYAGVFNNNYKGLYNDGLENTAVRVNVTNFSGNLTNSFTFAKTWTAEFSGWFNSSPSEGLLVGGAMGAMDVALSKQLFKKKATVKAGIRDLLRTSNFTGYSRYADVDFNLLNDRRKDSRQISLSFTYKFGRNDVAPARQRRSGAGEEQNRVTSGS